MLTGIAPAAGAQDARGWAKDEFEGWYRYFGDHPIRAGSRWELHFDAQYRAEHAGPSARQTVVRPGVSYHIRPSLQVSAGYAYTRSRLDGGDLSTTFPEHRVWEQLTLRQPVGRAELAHRVRVEQRYIGGAVREREDATDFVYRNRLRYRLGATVPFPAPSRVYVSASNELLLNVGKFPNTSFFNQNRATLAWGRRVGPDTSVEVGYLWQLVRLRGEETTVRRHVLQISVRSAAPLGF